MKNIVLASASPRRKDILEKFDFKIKVIESNIDEKEREFEDPKQIVMALAFEKAFAVAERLEEGIILAADTSVISNGEILGKPCDEDMAFKMLKNLSGREHNVITGFSIVEANSNKKIIDYVETRVRFKSLSDDLIRRYINTGEPMDKAGAYGIQGYGQLLIEGIEGSYLNVVGLPMERIVDILEEYFSITTL